MADDGKDGGDEGERPAPPARRPKTRNAPRAKYEALWILYRDGTREKRELMSLTQSSWRLVDEAIERGFPSLGLAPLREKAELWDRQKKAEKDRIFAEQDAQVLADTARAEVDNWKTFVGKATKLADSNADLMLAGAEQVRQAMGQMQLSSFVRYRRVRVEDPKTGVITAKDIAYVDAWLVSRFIQVLVSAAKENAQLMSFVLGGPTVRVDVAGPAPIFTPEQLQHIIATGQLPNGVTDEMLQAALGHTKTQ